MDYKTIFKTAIEENKSLILKASFLERGSGKTYSLVELALDYKIPILVGDRTSCEYILKILQVILDERGYQRVSLNIDSDGIYGRQQIDGEQVHMFDCIVVKHSDALKGKAPRRAKYLVDESVQNSILEHSFNYVPSTFIGFCR